MDKIQILLMGIIPLILAITLHEAAHGWVAKRFGDNTAYSQGRVTLNPLSHIDPIGTILLPAILFVTSGFIFGWAKPVPVQFGNLRKPKLHSIYVAAAGPLANLFMASLWAILFYFTRESSIDNVLTVSAIAKIGVQMNIVFMIFNLIPILPLDGGRILQGMLPLRQSIEFGKIEPYGIYIVFGLAMLGILTPIIGPVVQFLSAMLLYGVLI
jgi:Zn-dependent protease